MVHSLSAGLHQTRSLLRSVLTSACLTMGLFAPGAMLSAQEARPVAQDPVLEKKVITLSNELRCLVCQNQTIADSNAELAVDLRNQVRKQLSEGKSDREILDYMVQRYGEFVLYRPPLSYKTILLWAGPFALLLIAMFILVQQIRLRHKRLASEEFDQTDLSRARKLLDSAPGDRS
ncbi:cytochrome c-type biogenesis protein [Polynucleobacter difficilis]|uniref:cytochrome c-type biogenesis protein n=1 Tax=Polynucleobacter difficilis TaxID=556054 RepID=UPI002D79C993|nr:cytochrome c-type biogenesis protein [Polynucleobacter difficilis]